MKTKSFQSRFIQSFIWLWFFASSYSACNNNNNKNIEIAMNINRSARREWKRNDSVWNAACIRQNSSIKIVCNVCYGGATHRQSPDSHSSGESYCSIYSGVSLQVINIEYDFICNRFNQVINNMARQRLFEKRQVTNGIRMSSLSWNNN